MTPIVPIPITDWNRSYSAAEQASAVEALENGSVLFFPQLGFVLDEEETAFLSPSVVGDSKNVSFDMKTGSLRGSSLVDAQAERLAAMMRRFVDASNGLLHNLLPHYQESLQLGRTSFRPVEIAGRSTSWRKDDTRLHVDSFPSSPVQDKRILRVFSNVNPGGKGRSWRLGEPFETVAQRFLPNIHGPVWGSSQMLQILGITKSRRTAYDHYMLRLHDGMKADMGYQTSASQLNFDFPPGSTWIVYTDQVSHAAMGGQHLLEQTYYLPVRGMADPLRSPLKVLERLTGRELV